MCGKSLPPRIERSLEFGAKTFPDRPAIVSGADELNYGELLSRARKLADTLRLSGVVAGDRVTVYLDKTFESVVACYGIWLAGGIFVPAHEALHGRQLAYILDDSGSDILVTDARKLARIDKALLGERQIVEVDLSAGIGANVAANDAFVGENEPAAILYTSGSTGSPKGILVSHANLLAGTRIVSQYLELSDTDKIISVLPFSFDYGLNQLLSAIHVGATLVLQRSHLPADICRTLHDQAITGMAAVPPLWIQLLGRMSPFSKMEFPALRYITNSGGVFPVDAIRKYRKLIPDTRIFLMYGLSEAFRSTYLPPNEIDRRPGSMGKPIPETELHVVKDGRECAPGETGELVHVGPTVALGYWNEPKATARVFRPYPGNGSNGSDVAVFSGDYVRKDENGFLYFVGRRDTMIKTQGFRVSPDEVEELLLASGLVDEVAVTSAPDEAAGAIIIAHVVPRNSWEFSERRLLDFCRKEMPRHMIPARINVHSSLPKTASGKIDRKSVA